METPEEEQEIKKFGILDLIRAIAKLVRITLVGFEEKK